MVNLRRRPRLQRQCNIPKEREPVSLISNPNKTPKRGGPTKTSVGKNTSKLPKTQKSQAEVVDKQELEIEGSKSVNSRRSKRSRLDKSANADGATKTTPDGLVYEIGRRKPSDGSGTDEFVLRLNNSVNPKSKSKKKPVTSRNDVLVGSPKKQSPVCPEEKSPKSPPLSKRKNSKSPLRLSLKPEPRSPNQVFKLPRSSCARKQRVSVEVAAEVQNQEESLSVCSMILKKKKRKSSEGTAASEQEISNKIISNKSQHPLFAGISPIVASKKEIEKLESLEKSMNLFSCPMSPIKNPDQKDSLNYSNLALKPEIKSLPKRPKTRPQKKVMAKSKAIKKDADRSLLKTPIRQTFKAKTDPEPEPEGNDSLLFGDESEDSADDTQAGYTLYPLSDKSTWQPKPKATVNKSNSKKDETRDKMDYDKWLADHQEDYEQFKDLELCVE
ncbi:hypothetical protein ACHWQZ_G000910 [Mnemiopsis leidyi]